MIKGQVSDHLTRNERNNLKFFVILELMMRASQTSQPGIKEICSILHSSFNERLFEESLASVQTAFANVGQSDSKAKSDALTAEVVRLFEETLVVAL